MTEKSQKEAMFQELPRVQTDFITDIRMSILAQSPKGGRAILWVTVFLFVLATYWAYVSEIEEVTRANGKIIPSGQIQVVQNLEGGILSEILIEVGDTVEKDQLLLRIDETRFSSSFEENRLEYLAHKAKAGRLEAEYKAMDYTVPQEVVAEKPEIGFREMELFTSRKKELSNKEQMLEKQIYQRGQELQELKSKLRELKDTYALMQKELALTEPLVGQGAVSEVELLHLQRQASAMRGQIVEIEQSIPRVQSRHEETKLALEQERLAFRNKAKMELNEVQTKLAGFSVSAIALQDRLQRTAVRSPVYGTIKQILVNTVGGVIQPGMDLVEIVPLEDTLLVEARVKPADIAFLRPNQKAMVKFTAYDFTIYGGLEARLEHISADSITDERGDSYYIVRLRTLLNYLGQETNRLPIIPGMVTTVDILTGKKTILSYLLKPVLRAKTMALRER